MSAHPQVCPLGQVWPRDPSQLLCFSLAQRPLETCALGGRPADGRVRVIRKPTGQGSGGQPAAVGWVPRARGHSQAVQAYSPADGWAEGASAIFRGQQGQLEARRHCLTIALEAGMASGPYTPAGARSTWGSSVGPRPQRRGTLVSAGQRGHTFSPCPSCVHSSNTRGDVQPDSGVVSRVSDCCPRLSVSPALSRCPGPNV